jgi:hypothetical protein
MHFQMLLYNVHILILYASLSWEDQANLGYSGCEMLLQERNRFFCLLINFCLVAGAGLNGSALVQHEKAAKDSISQSDGLDLAYVLTIDNPAIQEATINLNVSNNSASELKMREVCTLEGCWINIVAFHAFDQSGNPLVVSYIPGDSSPGVWTIQTGGAAQILIEYSIHPKQGNIWTPMYFGYIGTNFAMFPAEYAFLLPDSSLTLHSLTISFDLPTDWQSVAPWPVTNSVYTPLDAPHIFFDTVFGGSVIGLGRFSLYQRTIGNSGVIIAVQDSLAPTIGQELAQKSWSIYLYISTSWGDSVGSPEVFIFTPNAADGKPIYGGSGPMGLAYSISVSSAGSFDFRWEDFAWELAETRWIDYDWGIVDNSCVWYKAGASRFEGLKAMARTRIMNSNEVENFLLGLYTDYINNYVNTGKDVPLASPNLYSDYTFHKVKGTLVNLLLARDIYLRTQGVSTYNKYNQYLIEKYGFKAEWLHEDQLKSELAILTQADFTQFFDNYIYGTVTLSMDWVSRDDDSDGLDNLLEIIWDTNPQLKDTDGDGYGDGLEVAIGSDPTDPNSYPRHIYLPVIFIPHSK